MVWIVASCTSKSDEARTTFRASGLDAAWARAIDWAQQYWASDITNCYLSIATERWGVLRSAIIDLLAPYY